MATAADASTRQGTNAASPGVLASVGLGAAGFRTTLEGFGRPDNKLGFAVSFGIVFHAG